MYVTVFRVLCLAENILDCQEICVHFVVCQMSCVVNLEVCIAYVSVFCNKFLTLLSVYYF